MLSRSFEHAELGLITAPANLSDLKFRPVFRAETLQKTERRDDSAADLRRSYFCELTSGNGFAEIFSDRAQSDDPIRTGGHVVVLSCLTSALLSRFCQERKRTLHLSRHACQHPLGGAGRFFRHRFSGPDDRRNHAAAFLLCI